MRRKFEAEVYIITVDILRIIRVIRCVLIEDLIGKLLSPLFLIAGHLQGIFFLLKYLLLSSGGLIRSTGILIPELPEHWACPAMLSIGILIDLSIVVSMDGVVLLLIFDFNFDQLLISQLVSLSSLFFVFLKGFELLLLELLNDPVSIVLHHSRAPWLAISI